MVIYADILFFINLLADMLCLFVSGRVMNLKISKLRLIVASGIGGIYGVVSGIFNLWEPVCGILVSVVMVLVCFCIKSFIPFLKTILLMYCTGMLLGGVMSFLTRIIYENREKLFFKNGIDLCSFVLLFAVVFIFFVFLSGIFGIYIHKRSVLCVISSENKHKTVRLLLDSGNMLKDPYTGKAVVIVKAEIIDDFLGKDGVHRGLNAYSEVSASEAKLHYISAKTVGGQLLLPVIGSLRINTLEKNGRSNELFASVASDSNDMNDYMGYDGVMPYMLEGSF